MTGIAILLAAAAAAYALARWSGLPATPLLILAGILLARLDRLPAEFLQEALVLGVTFLLFTTGTEMGPRRVRGQRRAAAIAGFMQFLVIGALGTGTALLLGSDLLTALYLGLGLTASSTFVVVRLLQRRRQMFEPSGRLVLGVLLLQDVLVILLLPVLVRMPEGIVAILQGMAGTLALVGLCWAVLRFVTPRIARLHGEEEELLMAALAVLFLFIGLADLLNVPLAASAFLAGVSLSSFPMSAVLRSQLGSVTEFFSAIFFLALGGLLTPPGLAVLGSAVALSLLVMVVTPLLVVVVAERTGFAARPAIESGLLLAQTSEISLVLGLQGLLLQQISADTFTVLALVTVTTIVLTPTLVAERVVRLLLRLHPVAGGAQGAAPEATERPQGHVLLLGCGSGGLPLLETLLSSGEQVVVIDDDPEIVEQLREGEVLCIRGDASDPEVLRQAGADRAKLISSTIRRPRDNAELLRAAGGVPILVRVFDDEDAEWVREAGGLPVLYSEEAASEFGAWFRGRFPAG